MRGEKTNAQNTTHQENNKDKNEGKECYMRVIWRNKQMKKREDVFFDISRINKRQPTEWKENEQREQIKKS